MTQLDSRWGEETGAIWNFLELAYRKGLIDEVFRLANTFADPKVNIIDIQGELEEKLSAFDFNSLDAKLNGQFIPLVKAFTDDEVLEGLTILIKMVRPLSEFAIANAGGDVSEAARKARVVGKSLKTLAMITMPVAMEKAMPILQLLLAGINQKE